MRPTAVQLVLLPVRCWRWMQVRAASSAQCRAGPGARFSDRGTISSSRPRAQGDRRSRSYWRAFAHRQLGSKSPSQDPRGRQIERAMASACQPQVLPRLVCDGLRRPVPRSRRHPAMATASGLRAWPQHRLDDSVYPDRPRHRLP
jgi:hypothetical protein